MPSPGHELGPSPRSAPGAGLLSCCCPAAAAGSGGMPNPAPLSPFFLRNVRDSEGIEDVTRFRVPNHPADRRVDGRDRDAADHQSGLDKPNNSSLGMGIGPIDAFWGQRKSSRRDERPPRGARGPAIGGDPAGPKPPFPYGSSPCHRDSALSSAYSSRYRAFGNPSHIPARLAVVLLVGACCG